MDDNSIPGRPGRRRSEDSRTAILAASFDILGELGYAGLTVERIAARSGCGKQTIYRWWPTKADVLLEALAAKADLRIPITDSGSYAGDLRSFLVASFDLGGVPLVGDLLRALMAEAQIDREFGERFRVFFIQRRRDALAVVLDRARDRGELRPGVSTATVTDIVFGTLWYRLLATDRPPDHTLAEELATILAGPAPLPPPPAAG